MIEFNLNIIKGQIVDNELSVHDSDPNMNDEIISVDPSEIRKILDKYKYFYIEHEDGSLSFSKFKIRNNLKKYLDSKGIKQTYLANKLNVSKVTINKYCNATNLELETVYKIMAALGIGFELTHKLFVPENFEILKEEEILL